VAGPFSFGSLMGFFAVFAVATRSCVMLVSRYQELERRETSTERAELVQRGTRDALATIIGSAMATALLLLPFVVLRNLAGYEMVHRMAVVVVCGLVSATLFAWLVVPALYLHIGRRAELDMAELLTHPATGAVTAELAGISGNGGNADGATTTSGREQT
jgi:Cu/Ag efflux pump CusA